MIPLVSLTNLATLPFLMFIVIRLYNSLRKNKDKNIIYFFLSFFFTLLMEAILSTPGLVFKNLYHIGIVYAIFPLLGVLALGFFAAIPFNILKRQKIEKVFLIFIIILSVLIGAINLINLKPVVTYQYSPFVYWEDTRGMTTNIFIGGLFGILLLFSVFFFLFNGLKAVDKYVQKRSFIISGGIFIFFLAALVNFVLGASQTQYKYITSIASAIIMIFGSIIIFAGISYKKKSSKVSYAENPAEYSKIQW